MAKDDDLLPKKRVSKTSKPAARAPSDGMVRLIRATRVTGLVLGGFVSVIAMMGVVGLVTDSLLVRAVAALFVVVGLPAFVSDRLLKKTSGGLSLVADVFAIILLGIALMAVGADFATKPLLIREGDRYARTGSTTMARVVYFLAGVNPLFPTDKAAAPASSAAPSVAPDAGKK